MTVVYAALLGVVQGLTEFLPVSSSAHLILTRAVVGFDIGGLGLSFDVACHLGTLVAVVFCFRSEVFGMVVALPRIFTSSADPDARRLRLIAVASIPIMLVGAGLGDYVEQHLRTPMIAIAALAAGAVVILVAERLGSRRRGEASLGMGEAFAIGVGQALALVPGVSRSGATIVLGMSLGLRRDAAARFGFLLGLPAILAAAARAGWGLERASMEPGWALVFAIGMLTSGTVGYLAVTYFLRYVGRHPLDPFAYYRLALASGAFVWLY